MSDPSRLTSALAWVLIASGAAFGCAATHDYLAWQRARWRAVAWLDARAVAPEGVAGGFEVDQTRGEVALGASRDKGPWYLSLAPLGDAGVVRRFEVGAWLPWSIGEVLVLHRDKRPLGTSSS